MALTRGQFITNVATALERPDDTAFKTQISGRLDQMLFVMFDMHDWNWKHKEGTFSTVSGTETYDVSTSSVDVRSSQDLEVLYDSTNKTVLSKTTLRTLRRQYPEGLASGKPERYAPWDNKSIHIDNIPDAVYVMKYLYLAKATLPTSDDDDLEAVCGVPDYAHYLLEKLVLSEMMIIDNDDRRQGLLVEITKMWRPLAINADMKHLESSARFRFFEEELGVAYDQIDPLNFNCDGYED